MEKNQIKIHERITALEVETKNIAESLNLVKNNHLPHIQDRLDKIDIRMAYYTGGLAVLTVAVPILINIFFK